MKMIILAAKIAFNLPRWTFALYRGSRVVKRNLERDRQRAELLAIIRNPDAYLDRYKDEPDHETLMR
jgi:hypothetical protein